MRPEQSCYVMQGVSWDVMLVSSELLVLSALILFCFVLFCQHESRESARRDPEPTPSSNQSRKFVRFIDMNFVLSGKGIKCSFNQMNSRREVKWPPNLPKQKSTRSLDKINISISLFILFIRKCILHRQIFSVI